jgi:hypothetical protein
MIHQIATVAGGSSSLFTAVASLHPAMVDPKDVEQLKIPIAVFASKDEPKSEIAKSHEILKTKPFADKSVRRPPLFCLGLSFTLSFQFSFCATLTSCV